MMKYTRRHFIKTGLAGLGGLALGGSLLSSCSQSQKSTPVFYDPYELVTIGQTSIKTTRLAMGTGIHGGRGESNLTRLGFDSGVKLVQNMYERGIRSFDCADAYGSHFIVGEALKNYPRADHTIFTKIVVRDNPQESVENSVERFLKELQTDYIDILALHFMTSPNWNTEYSDAMESISKLKEKGLIRSHGISSHSLGALRLATEEPWAEVCYVRFNPFGINMDGSIDEVFPIVESMHNAGKGVIGMKIYGEGKFANDAEKKDESLTLSLRSGVVDILDIGMDKMSDLLDTEERIRKIAI